MIRSPIPKISDSPVLSFVLPPFSAAVHCSATKGVTNEGTIVHCNRQEKGNGQERKEQLFTARREEKGEIDKGEGKKGKM